MQVGSDDPLVQAGTCQEDTVRRWQQETLCQSQMNHRSQAHLQQQQAHQKGTVPSPQTTSCDVLARRCRWGRGKREFDEETTRARKAPRKCQNTDPQGQ